MFTGLGPELESVVIGMGHCSVWAFLNSGFTEFNHTLSTNGVGPVNVSMGAGPVLGWGRRLVSLELAWSWGHRSWLSASISLEPLAVGAMSNGLALKARSLEVHGPQGWQHGGWPGAEVGLGT